MLKPHVLVTHKVLIAKKSQYVLALPLKTNVYHEQNDFDYHYEPMEALITGKSLHTLLTFGKWLKLLCC